MKFSESWLREWVNPEISTQNLVDQITMAGLEVDAVEPVAGEFSGVVVGEILAAEAHPDADKLRVCRVAGSPEGEVQVVCGAANARPGIKVPFALVGASLPGDFKIKKAKLRGVESFGMLCAQTELQAGDDDSGLWELPADAPTGTDLRDYLALNDQLIEVDLTPNRADCLSLKGLAREVGVLNKVAVNTPAIAPVAATIDTGKTVALKADAACSRYLGRVIKNIDITRPSPLWLQEKLRRSGVRSIDAVVDVTNYLLLELGQPMHAFDFDKLQGGIQVRLAGQGEPLTLLDGSEVALNGDTLVIADDSGAIAMAGIMGGASTAVSESTRDIFLESAFFHPLAIAGRARAYGLHTDSSHRFERGVDYNGAEPAIERATALLLAIVGGEAGPLVRAENDQLPAPVDVFLNRARIESGLGFAIPDGEVVDILTRLGLTVVEENSQGWRFAVPSYRFDITLEVDLLEELARIYGYNNLPTTAMRIPAQLSANSDGRLTYGALAAQLVARGYQEVITYSFIDPKIQVLFAPGQATVNLLNPISADMSVMRTSLLPGLVSTLIHNLKRQKTRARIFEKGLTFVPAAAGLVQAQALAGLVYGSRVEAGWGDDKGDVDFYDIKGDLEALLALNGRPLSFARAQAPALHPGQCAEVLLDGEVVGVVGAIHPQLVQQLDLAKTAFVFELALDKIRAARIPSCAPISRFPEVNRDLAVLVARDLAVVDIQHIIEQAAGEHLKNLKVFDVYAGEGIDPQRKSVAFNLTFQHPSRTLSEDEINHPMAAILKRLEDEFDARLR